MEREKQRSEELGWGLEVEVEEEEEVVVVVVVRAETKGRLKMVKGNLALRIGFCCCWSPWSLRDIFISSPDFWNQLALLQEDDSPL